MKRIIILSIIILIASRIGQLQELDRRNSSIENKNNQLIIDSAVPYFYRLTDQKEFKTYIIDVKTETISDTTTPVFNEIIKDFKLAILRLDTMIIQVPNVDVAYCNSKKWIGEILCDYHSNSVIKIHLKSLTNINSNKNDSYDFSWVESDITDTNITGFPSEVPSKSFVDILASAIVGNPLDAQEITAVYTTYSNNEENILNKDIWFIYLKGLPPQRLIDPDTGKLEKILNCHDAFAIYDANTGDYIKGSQIAK